MKARTVVIALAVAAVAIAAIFTQGHGGGGGRGGGRSAPKNAVHVAFALSPEKEALVRPLVDRFNDERHDAGGKPVFVDLDIVASGDAEARIARSRYRPVLWSPSSSLWGRLLERDADRDWVDDDNPSLVRTPLVIAMWEPLARALGWPRKQVGFEQVLKLATSKRGWAAYGRPEYGQFKLGHTNPDFSTSGLSAVAAEYYAATGKREGLSIADVDRPAVRTRIKAIERSIVHYGDTTLFFADQLKRYGPAYASAVAMEEATLVDFNEHRGSATKLVGLYPKEGTFFSDNPALVLRAPWVTRQQRAGAQAFVRWLTGHLDPGVVSRAGFRPGDPDVKPQAPIDAAHGADPALPSRVLALPQPDVLARVRTAWREDRKPANIVLAVDVSGSMSEENKLDQAKQGLRVFFSQLSPNDRIGMIAFNDRLFQPVPFGTYASVGPRLRRAVADLLPDGETAFRDATARALEQVRDLHDPTRINAVVVLTDGQDTASSTSAASVEQALAAQARAEGLAVRVYTIAYGSDADRDTLTRLARASGGKDFVGDPKSIESVYRSISSFF